VLRIGTIWGPLGDPASPFFPIPSLINATVRGTEPPAVYAGDGGDRCYAADCGRAIALLMTGQMTRWIPTHAAPRRSTSCWPIWVSRGLADWPYAGLVAKGALPGIHFQTGDLDASFEKVRAAGAEIVQEPTEQFWGTKDFAVRDPSGNMVRVDQPPTG
jgi:catechol 2,3-dioxygenase-like lactoylglutathione lyase family enzyme